MPTRRVAPPPDLALPALCPPRSFVVFQADVSCYLCGEICGGVESPTPPPFPLLLQFQPVGAATATPTRWARLRCPRCGGGVYLEDPHPVRRWTETINWALDAPRRGRPPKWLVDMRRQNAA